MPIPVHCPNCQNTSAVPNSHAGRNVRCKRCGVKFPVPLATGPAASLPAVVDRYQVRELLGEGSFGAVYRAFDPRLERDVALKVLRPEVMTSPQAVERFLREGKAAAKLFHPYIVPVYDAGQSGTVYYIASAFIRGQTLDSAIPEGGMAPQRAAELAAQLASALGYAHRQGVLHRDVKPANAMLNEQGSLHLMDFGLAGSTQEGDARLTRLGAIMGTPAYMSPEQASGDTARVGPASDLYSAGVVLYEMLTGCLPFEGGHHVALSYQIVHVTPAPPSERRPGLDAGVEAICLRAMAKDPALRYGSGEEMAAALTAWAATAPAMVVPVGARPAEANPPPGVFDRETVRPAPRRPSAAPLIEKVPAASRRPAAAPTIDAPAPKLSVFDRETVVPASKRSTLEPPASAQSNPTTPPRALQVGKRAADLSPYLLTPWPWVIAGGVAALLVLVWLIAANARRPPVAVLKPSDDFSTPAPKADDKEVPRPLPVDQGATAPAPSPAAPPPSPAALPVSLRLLPIADIVLEAGQSKTVAVRVERRNCPGPIELRLEGLPDGVLVQPSFIPADADAGQLELTAAPNAAATNQAVHLVAGAAAARSEDQFQIGVSRPLAKEKPAPLAEPSPLDCTGEKGASAAEVRRAQEAWAKYLGRQVEEEDEIAPGVRMKFVLMPPGKFLMGSTKSQIDDVMRQFPDAAREVLDCESPLHEVELRRPIYLGVNDVTQGQYEVVTGKNPSTFKGTDLPVETVTWEEADAFATKLTEKAKGGLVYRLPTESEWEYSSRGGRPSSSPFGIGDGTSLSSREANFAGNYPYGRAEKGPYLDKTSPVGSYKANALGLYDMQGNVWQWCGDVYGDYPTGRVVDPTGPAPSEGSSRVRRGGSWFSFARSCRAAFRSWAAPDIRFSYLGVRLARVPPSGQGK